MITLRDDELHWSRDTAFHEFGPATVDADGASGERYRMFVVGGRGATAAEEAKDEGVDEPVVLVLSTALSGERDGPPLRISADSARDLAQALLDAADEADHEHCRSGRTIDAIMQGMVRAWRRRRAKARPVAATAR